MRLNERIKAIEQRAVPAENGVVIVANGETVGDAIRCAGKSQERIHVGIIIIPAKQERDDARN